MLYKIQSVADLRDPTFWAGLSPESSLRQLPIEELERMLRQDGYPESRPAPETLDRSALKQAATDATSDTAREAVSLRDAFGRALDLEPNDKRAALLAEQYQKGLRRILRLIRQLQRSLEHAAPYDTEPRPARERVIERERQDDIPRPK